MSEREKERSRREKMYMNISHSIMRRWFVDNSNFSSFRFSHSTAQCARCLCNLPFYFSSPHSILWAFTYAVFLLNNTEMKKTWEKIETHTLPENGKKAKHSCSGWRERGKKSYRKNTKHALPTMKHIIIMLVHLIGSFRYCVTWHLSWSPL